MAIRCHIMQTSPDLLIIASTDGVTELSLCGLQLVLVIALILYIIYLLPVCKLS